MKKFMDEDFLLESETAKNLYEKYAKNMPIFDYHCHLNPQEIYEDKKFSDITQAWLVDGNYGDHYKWRIMRGNGVSEEYITGNKTNKEKFDKWAETLPNAIGNPLYHWAHMELKTFFEIDKVLSSETKDEIYDICNEKLKTLTARKFIEKSNVKIICTTDDPVDDLKWHKLLKEDKSFKTKVLPAFRPDKAINIELSWFLDWVKELEKVTNIQTNCFNSFIEALEQRIDYFHEIGCRISDHALDIVPYEKASINEVEEIYKKRICGKELSTLEINKYKTYMLMFFAKQYKLHDWVMQYHISALRNNSSRMLSEIGPDTGFDAIDDTPFVNNLSKIMNDLDNLDILPKTIVYSLNPNYYSIITALIYCFQKDVPGKMQLGSAWWFNDQKDGMYKQLSLLANTGLISTFVGMLTDSRSFLSYPRHDYFRRILCNFFARLIDNGEYPNDIDFVGKMVSNICYYNALNYFNIKD